MFTKGYGYTAVAQALTVSSSTLAASGSPSLTRKIVVERTMVDGDNTTQDAFNSKRHDTQAGRHRCAFQMEFTWGL